MTSDPETYEYRELGDCIDLIIDHRGKTPKKLNSDWVEEGIPTISAKNVNSGKLVARDAIRYVTTEVYKKWMKEDVRPGDCFLVSEGATLGECLYWDNDYPIVLGQRIFCIRTNPEVLYPRYFYAYMASAEFQSEIVGRATGSSVPGLRQTEVLKLKVKVLPMEQQIFIGDLHYRLNKKIEKNTETNQTLEHIAQAIFKSWFVDFEPTRAKIAAKQAGQDHERAAMAAISGKSLEELDQLSAEQQEKLKTTAALFPDALVDSELGEIPEGWGVKKIGDIIERLKPSRRYTKKQVEPFGLTPVYEQGASILMGYHNEEPCFRATPDEPLFIFGDHTCVIHMSCDDFDISQNVIPLSGCGYPTTWVYYAIQGKQEFQEYRRHWSEFVIKEVVCPDEFLPEKFSEIVTSLYKKKERSVRENKEIEQLRDALLPKLLSGELAI